MVILLLRFGVGGVIGVAFGCLVCGLLVVASFWVWILVVGFDSNCGVSSCLMWFWL